MKNAVVTGVSTGIGYAAVQEFLNQGFRVFGSVRKKEDADRLSAEFGSNFIPLLFDVTDGDAILAGAKLVQEKLGNESLTTLVNNAGIAVAGPTQELDLDEFRKQFEVNFFGLIAVTQAFLPMLGAKLNFKGKPGRIINISSVSGKFSFPFIGPYASSKHAVEGLSNSLRRELVGFGVDVVILGPGAVSTPIWGKSPKPSDFPNSLYATPLKNIFDLMAEKGKEGIPVERVGKLIVKVALAKKPKARYPIVGSYLKDWWIPQRLPARMLDRMFGKMLGLFK